MLYEIKKMISRRGLIIWGAWLILVSLLCPLYCTYNYNKFYSDHYENVDASYHNIWNTYQGKGDFAAIVEKAAKERREFEVPHIETPMSAYKLYRCKKSARETGKSTSIYFDFNMEKHCMQGIEMQLSKNKNTGSYQYQNLIKEKSMMESCELEYANVFFWNEYDTWETCIVFSIFLFILFICSGIYVKERSSNMNFIIGTAQAGDFRIIRNKWLAGCILGIGSIFLVNINLLISFIIFGSGSGFNVNLVNLGAGFVYTPYNLPIYEYMLLKILFQIMGMILLVVFAECMSLLSTYRYQVVFYGGLLFIPQLVCYFAVGREYFQIMDIFYDWSLLAAIYPEHAFYKYHTYNVFGNPVNYNIIYIIVIICFIIFFGILTVKKYQKYNFVFNR